MAVALMRDTHEELVKRVEELKQEIRENSQDIKEAASQGDLSENAEYDSAKERQSMLHYKLNQLQMYMNVEIFDEEDINTDVVSFGTQVTLEDTHSGETIVYNLVGPAELELENYENIMTYTSPLAKAMIGKNKEEKVEIKKPDKHLSYIIKDIQSAIGETVEQD